MSRAEDVSWLHLDRAWGTGLTASMTTELPSGGPDLVAPAADLTRCLTMIAVRPRRQGQGRGAASIQHVEDHLRARDQRLLLVQTSGLAAFERTRVFYDRCGYEREARVRDYYEPGDDMVLFRKAL